jgi:hypothetical protein
MPQILNVYTNPNNSLGESLKDLGNSIWGPQAASAEYAKQKARGAARNNAAEEAIMQNAARNGGVANLQEVGPSVYGVENPERTFQAQRGLAANIYGADSPQATNAFVGAGGGFGSTAQGERETHENQRVINDMTTRRQLDMARYQHDNTPYVVADPNDPSRGIVTTQSRAVGQPTQLTKEQLVTGALQHAMQPGAAAPAPQGVPYQTAGMPSASTGAAPAPQATSPDPFVNVPPSLRQAAGVMVPEQSMVEPRSGMIGISRDGGLTVDLPDGRRLPAQSNGFLPTNQESALAQSRDNNVRASAAQPLATGNPTNGQVGQDASTATGLAPWAATALNEHLGSIPFVPGLIKGATGSPEISPDIQGARSRLDVLAQQARSTLLGAPGRQSIQAQKWVNELLPEGHAFENPATAQNNVKTIVDAMAADYEQERQQALDPNLPPADRAKIVQHMRQIQNTVALFTRPAQEQQRGGSLPSTPAQPPAAPAPQAQPQGVDPTPHIQTGQDGVKYVDTNQGRLFLRNGQWTR